MNLSESHTFHKKDELDEGRAEDPTASTDHSWTTIDKEAPQEIPRSTDPAEGTTVNGSGATTPHPNLTDA